MKYIKIMESIIFALSFWTSLIFTEMGCLDNSEHLQRKYDSKNWHYVECYCPCLKLINHGTQCASCGHKRLLPRLIEQADPLKKGYTGSLSQYPKTEHVMRELSSRVKFDK